MYLHKPQREGMNGEARRQQAQAIRRSQDLLMGRHECEADQGVVEQRLHPIAAILKEAI